MTKKFLRRDSNRYSKLGRLRKSKQTWRRPTGRDNKMREKRKGYPKVVSVGYKKAKKDRKEFVLVMNVKDLEGLAGEIIIGKVGKKKKAEIMTKAKEKGLKVLNPLKAVKESTESKSVGEKK